MKAFVVDKYKKKGALRLANVPEPELRDDDVLVRVHATAVNLLDSKVRDGEFKLILPYRPPFILGHDVAGTLSGLARRSGGSRRATRFMHDRAIIGSEHSRNSLQ
ncbi:NADPH:quinone reductase-like Zn-dependent oxidoreductase [Bradyrhizobium sp. AZCC 1678]